MHYVYVPYCTGFYCNLNSPGSFEPYELIITYDAHLNLIWDIVPGLFIWGDNDRYSPCNEYTESDIAPTKNYSAYLFNTQIQTLVPQPLSI